MMNTGVIKAPNHLRKINVLVIDNDQRIITILADVLRCFGFRNIYEARDGFSAVQALRQQEIDLILTDWELRPLKRYSMPANPIVRSDQWSPVPPTDGAHFVQYVRLSKYSPDHFVPIIMFTGLGLQRHIEYGRDAGVNEIILKPLSIESLCDRISMIIDHPRCFVTASTYRGPCRRLENIPRSGQPERRKHDIILFKHTA